MSVIRISLVSNKDSTAYFAANLVSRFEIYFAIKFQSSAFAPRFQNPLEAAKRRPKIARRFNAGYPSAHYESHRDGRTNVTKFPPYPSILSGKPLPSLRDSSLLCGQPGIEMPGYCHCVALRRPNDVALHLILRLRLWRGSALAGVGLAGVGLAGVVVRREGV